jgi:hypothetical protein
MGNTSVPVTETTPAIEDYAAGRLINETLRFIEQESARRRRNGGDGSADAIERIAAFIKTGLERSPLANAAVSKSKTNRTATPPGLRDNTLLCTIAALAACWPKGKVPSGKELERAAQAVGVNVADGSILKALAAAKELAPTLTSLPK